MVQRILRYLNLLWQLCKTDLVVFKQFVLQDIINIFVWFSCFLIVSAYIFPALGMFKKFGEFAAFSLIAAESYWRIWPACFDLVGDLEGDRIIDYYLTLPIPSWLVFIKFVLVNVIKSIVFGFVTFPLSLLILWNKITFDNFSIPKFIAIFLAISLFTGFFFIFLSSITKNVQSLRKIGIRIILPLWFFGAAEFPWKAIYSLVSPKLAYVLLLNPWLYAMEGIHAAALGQAKFLSFWLCLTVLFITSVLFGIIGILKLKRRLDLV